MVTEYDLLARAHELIQQGWCRGALARDLTVDTTVDETATHPNSPNATSWCLVGAIERAAGENGVPWQAKRSLVERGAIARIGAIIGTRSKRTHRRVAMVFNDRAKSREEVLAVLARAAEAARQEGEK